MELKARQMVKFRQCRNPVLMVLLAYFFAFQTIPAAFATENPRSDEHLDSSIAVTIENSQVANAPVLESDSTENVDDDLEPELLLVVQFPALVCVRCSDANLFANSWSQTRKQHPARAPPQV